MVRNITLWLLVYLVGFIGTLFTYKTNSVIWFLLSLLVVGLGLAGFIMNLQAMRRRGNYGYLSEDEVD